MDLRKEMTVRSLVVYVGAIMFGLAIIGRIVYLQVVEAESLAKKARSFSQKDITIKPRRGDILAIDGRLLASSVPYYDIYWDSRADYITDAYFNSNVDSLALGLSAALKNRSRREYRQYLSAARINGRRYLPIKRNATYLELKKIQDLPIFRDGKFKGGLIVEHKDKRTKPFVDLASRTIGFLVEQPNREKKGFVGIERAYEQQLKGREGVRLMQRLSGGGWMPINNGQQVDAIDGLSVVSTIDINLQDVAHNALLRVLKKNHAESGCAVLMETATGEVRAIVNLKLGKSGQRYYEDHNDAIGTLSEPGSTFKLASLLVAIDEGVVRLHDSIDIEDGTTRFFDRIMRDNYQKGGVITVREAFELSSNVAISKIINQHYFNRKQYFANKLFQMGASSKLGIDLIGEPAPDIKDVSKWSGTSLAWMSIGYEVQLTPMQILAFYNAIANDGRMVKPKFVKGLQESGNWVHEFPTEVIRQSICSKNSVAIAKELLEGVVERGTARNIYTKNYRIAGKTGTSQVGYGSKASKMSHQASFVGFFPADRPKYSCIVVVANPQRGHIYGSDVAAPVFREIADKVYASNLELAWEGQHKLGKIQAPFCRNGNAYDLMEILSILDISYSQPDYGTDWVATTNRDSLVAITPRRLAGGTVPNVAGMGLRDAMYLLENAGLKVTPIGIGAVRKQSIEPGSRVQKGRQIIIELG
jgi:cell division protein FtsI (penicillin-binding protein 3)